VISATTGKKASAKSELALGSGSAAPRAVVFDAAVVIDAPSIDAPPIEPPLEGFIDSFHQALGGGDAAALAALLDAKAFAFGVEAHDVAEGKDAVAKLAIATVGKASVVAKFHQVGREGDVAWVAEELRAGSRTFVATYVVGLGTGGWSIAALHLAVAMPNETAYKLARDGDLSIPDAIPDVHDESALAVAMRTAFASRTSFVDARSTRADAFNFGSAPNERLSGGDQIKKVFGRIRATVHLHDAVRVGTVGTLGGWGAANVDFTDADRDGTDVTQTFRVLAAWVNEPAGWRIVQTQWSNPR
jgi:acyl-coenzyme A thioesterase PaaI-like protein